MLPQLLFEVRNCFVADPEQRKWDCIHVGACCPEFRLEYLFDLLAPGGRIAVRYDAPFVKGNLMPCRLLMETSCSLFRRDLTGTSLHAEIWQTSAMET